MKNIKTSIAIFLFLFISANANSQAKIEYDFNTGTFLNGDFVDNGKLKPIQTGTFITFVVKNVNTFRYDVEIAGKSFDYVTEVPSELQAIFRLPGSTTNTTEGQNNIETGTALMVQELAATTEKISKTKDKIEQKNELITNKKKLKNRSKADNAFIATNEDSVKTFEVIKEGNEEFEKALEALVESCKELVEITKKIATIKFSRQELITVSKQDWASHKEMKNSLPALLSKEEMKKNFSEFTEYYADAIALYNKAYFAATDDEQRKIVADAKKQIDEGHKKIAEDDYLKMIDDIIVLQDALNMVKTFDVVSPAVQVDGDYVEFKVKASPVKANDLMNHIAEKNLKFEVPACRGLKVDFSVGPTFSLGKKARDENYYLKESVPTDDNVILAQRENNNSITPGIAAFMHFYPRTGRNWAWGGAFGVGAGFQNADDVLKTSFYFGPTAVIGKRQKIMLTAGLSFLKVARLKFDEYEVGKTYERSKIDIGNVTEKVFANSFFFSVTYNITNRVEVK